MAFTVLLDANVLYPAPLRDLLLELAVSDMFRAKWSARIQDEWVNALLRNEPHRDPARLQRTRELMEENVRDVLVEGYEDLIPAITLPDLNDRHVVAAAIKSRSDLIVTFNLKHFPAAEMAKWDLEAQHPDKFLEHQFHLSQPGFLNAVKTCRARLRNPPKSVEEYIDALRRNGVFVTAKILEEYSQLI